MTHGIQRLDLSEAQALLRQQLTPSQSHELCSIESARGRIAAHSIDAPISLPPFRSSAMDGYAGRAQDFGAGSVAEVAGVSAAGHPFQGNLEPGQCIRILTGAVVPDVADCIVIQEDVEAQAAHPTLAGLTAAIKINAPGKEGDNIRLVGHDVAVGHRLIEAGTMLGVFELAWLAACGVAQISVRPKLRVGLLATGDELQQPGQRLAPGQIFDSNRLLVRELFKNLPIELVDLGVVRDDKAAVQRTIEQGCADLDAIVSTGGVSVGDADYITEVVSALGELEFWRLNLKPGKPMAVGRLGSTAKLTWFFGLPGNPVSCAVTAMLIAAPALGHLGGATPKPPMTIKAQLSTSVRHKAGRQEYIRGTLVGPQPGDQTQANRVVPTGDQSSNRLASFQQANCLVSIPKTVDNLTAGDWVDVLPLSDLI